MLTSNLYKFCMPFSDMFGLNIFIATLKYFISDSLSSEPYRSAEMIYKKDPEQLRHQREVCSTVL